MLGPLLSVGTFAKTCRFDVWRSLCTSITSANSVPTCCAAGHTVEALFCRWTGEHEQKTKLGTWGWRRLEPETGPVWLSSPCRLPSFCTSVVSPLLVSMEFTEGAMFQNTTETIARRGHRCADNHTEMLNNLWRGGIFQKFSHQVWVFQPQIDLWNLPCQFILHYSIPPFLYSKTSSFWWISLRWNCSAWSVESKCKIESSLNMNYSDCQRLHLRESDR